MSDLMRSLSPFQWRAWLYLSTFTIAKLIRVPIVTFLMVLMFVLHFLHNALWISVQTAHLHDISFISCGCLVTLSVTTPPAIPSRVTCWFSDTGLLLRLRELPDYWEFNRRLSSVAPLVCFRLRLISYMLSDCQTNFLLIPHWMLL